MPTHDRLNGGSREHIHLISLSHNEIGSLANDRAGANQWGALPARQRASMNLQVDILGAVDVRHRRQRRRMRCRRRRGKNIELKGVEVLSGPLTRLETGARG